MISCVILFQAVRVERKKSSRCLIRCLVDLVAHQGLPEAIWASRLFPIKRVHTRVSSVPSFLHGLLGIHY